MSAVQLPRSADASASLMPLILGNALVLILFALDFRSLHDGLIEGQVVWGRDFINVWTAGKMVLAGRLDILYDPATYHAYQQTLFGPVGPHNYSYPPLALPLMVPFALLPYGVALAAWLVATGWLFVRAAAPWWREATPWHPVVVLLTPAALINVWAGHYGFLIGALLLFGWRNLQAGKPVLAGLCFGLMAIKPHLAILIPLILLIRREWGAMAAAAVTVAALVLVSILLFGLTPWYDFLTITTSVQTRMIDAQGAFFSLMSTSTSTAVLAIGFSATVAGAVQFCGAAIALVLVGLAARRAALRDVALLAATATFLVLPYAFNYDLVVSAMGAAMIMGHPLLSRLEQRLAQFGVMAAQLGMLLAAGGMPLMPLLLLALAIVQYRLAMRSAARAGVTVRAAETVASARRGVPAGAA